MRPDDTRKTHRLCETAARAKPIVRITLPETIVQRVPMSFIRIAGRGLARPHARQRRAKLEPAADRDQCSSEAILYNTPPRDANVAAVMKKNSRETTPKIHHARRIDCLRTVFKQVFRP